MDNWGDWLYIVLLVIAGISGILSSGKKRKQPTEILGDPDYTDSSEPEYSNQEEEISSPQPIITKTTEKKPDARKNYTPLFKEGERIMPDSVSNLFSDSPCEDDKRGISGDALQDMEELKKAILYSEILHRKY
jgi:hypothetical protein